jgi:ketosteroid isomerase-like protein
MKPIAFIGFLLTILSCTTHEKNDIAETQSSIQLPFVAVYSSQFNQNVSDQDLLTVLNNYKAWENGDMEALRFTMADSITFHAANGNIFNGLATDLVNEWKVVRLDTLSSVAITMDAWQKSHSIDKNEDFVNVWYTIKTVTRSGRINSANYQDFNKVRDGKIVYISRHKQMIK